VSFGMPWGKTGEAARPLASAAPSREEGSVSRRVRASDSDLDLIRAFRSGSEEAFDQLFARHEEYVFNICLGILGNADDARDCTQEAFLRVYRKVGEFRAHAAFSTWLYRVTVNVCVAHLRKRPRAAAASLEDENVREIPDTAPDVGLGLEREVDEKLVRETVAMLPEDYRLVLVLRYFQNLSYEEMMQVLGYNLGQVKVKLHRARRAFAKKWAERGLQAVGLS
jgi:RNA polymerase sigma-70 factor, ECF subfamily